MRANAAIKRYFYKSSQKTLASVKRISIMRPR
ncbi:hypothetical protein Vch1786_I2596 [Vibrio cholerae O1 str. 2010EL-1786]|uniref:Uncharacterized protein n=2 Tax=Vibrio cholerae TaxID=666 RepID=Q9KV45_VIBCH|nr:hypothetical protein VC_0313 [Vibrio cholerae O1 biovar El Tor str. N16961]ACP04626.1 conserved hypothetical protein [Vibrio cholerae M66-2]ACP08380.1 conserved hypothetical protein [Vibrio cholerae O395]AET28159.1 hypothetical protein Vch1786_I2596 [Vibrio cholerae O1 str. 2010EL-1786]